jgi:hypothetical protein
VLFIQSAQNKRMMEFSLSPFVEFKWTLVSRSHTNVSEMQ